MFDQSWGKQNCYKKMKLRCSKDKGRLWKLLVGRSYQVFNKKPYRHLKSVRLSELKICCIVLKDKGEIVIRSYHFSFYS